MQTGSGSVTLNWNSVPGATGYNVFYATVPYLESANIGAYAGNNMRLDVTSPVTLTGLTNGTTYYFVVTAINDSNEGPDSQSVSATPLTSAMANNPTAQEVLLVELINRARFDPEAEASRYGISLNQGLAPGTISAIQKPPIAHNALLMRASRDHSQWMLNTRTFSHTGEGASTPTQRITAAGYTLSGSWTTGENISARGTSSSSINLTTQTPLQHRGLFESPGHRVNILNANYREVGIGQKKGAFLFPPNTGEYLTSMITQKFARSGSNYFVTGVIYNDSNDNNFYDVGEGLGGINISITGGSNATTNSAGAYSVARGNGTYTVTINGLAQPVSEEIIVSGSNIKFDVIVSGDDVSINTW